MVSKNTRTGGLVTYTMELVKSTYLTDDGNGWISDESRQIVSYTFHEVRHDVRATEA